MKITTNDCRKFLANFFTTNENYRMMGGMFDAGEEYEDGITEERLFKDMCTSSKWLRERKHKPLEEAYQVTNVDGTRTIVVASNILCIRVFMCDPDTWDTQVMYQVIEDKNGKLHLGEYVGD